MGHTIISAAIMDDILGLFLPAILTTMIVESCVRSATEIVLLIAKAAGFFVAVRAIARFLMPHLDRLSCESQYEGIEFSLVLIISLAFGIATEYAGKHFVIGALLVGMFLQEDTFGANRRI